ALRASAVPAFGDPGPVMTVVPCGADTAAALREPADRSQNAFGADLILPGSSPWLNAPGALGRPPAAAPVLSAARRSVGLCHAPGPSSSRRRYGGTRAQMAG